MRFLSADVVFPISSPPVPQGIVAVKDDGSIDGVYTAGLISGNLNIEKYQGILCPGFVNAHCHLELSYLKGRIKPQTGLTGFIDQLLKERNQNNSSALLKQIADADKTMFDNGINAVGDIANETISFEIKKKSRIAYHTFIELYDFLEERTDEVFNHGQRIQASFPQLRHSLTPHATYSVTQNLLNKIIATNNTCPVTVHHNETQSEMELLENGTGELAIFFQRFFKKDFRIKSGIAAIRTLLEKITDEQPLILVHNTYCTAETVNSINASGKKIYWCFCPKANLYIENRLPDFSAFQPLENCCLGTDSLASNDTLCILEEIKSILFYYPEIPTEELLKWATLNGARALMMEDQLGSFDKNKKPGILHIEKTEGDKITQGSRVKRLI